MGLPGKGPCSSPSCWPTDRRACSAGSCWRPRSSRWATLLSCCAARAPKTAGYGIHGATALVMAVITVLLLAG